MRQIFISVQLASISGFQISPRIRANPCNPCLTLNPQLHRSKSLNPTANSIHELAGTRSLAKTLEQRQMNGALLELKSVIQPRIRPFCGPLLFARSRLSPVGTITASGSFGLVDTGSTKLLVTCCHVWRDYITAKKNKPETRLLACLDAGPPVVIDILSPIDEDESLDIATFNLQPILAACSGRRFYDLYLNPPPPVSVGDRLAFVGYPGQFRIIKDGGVYFGRMNYGVQVSDVSRHHMCANMSNARLVGTSRADLQSAKRNYGGISGSPCFLVRTGAMPQLVGFATSSALRILRFTHASCLNSDGTINRRSF